MVSKSTRTMLGTWCDGLERYLYGNAEAFPEWMRDGHSRHAALIDPREDLVDKGPLTVEDRIYFMAHDAATNLVIPSWAVVKIMEAMKEGRRVAVYAPTEESFLALYEIVVHPDAMPVELAGPTPLPN